MFKNIIAPVQAWLLSQGRCVGCGTSLSNGKRQTKKNNEEQVTCKKCGRIFLYNHETKRYQRAPLS
jgi:predicted  nucleic acid-binding Zn-ribbon protein